MELLLLVRMESLFLHVGKDAEHKPMPILDASTASGDFTCQATVPAPTEVFSMYQAWVIQMEDTNSTLETS